MTQILKPRSYHLPKDLLARRAQVPIWWHFLPLHCPKLDLIPNIGRNLHAKFKVEVEKKTKTRILEAKNVSLIKRTDDEALKCTSFVWSFWKKNTEKLNWGLLTFYLPNVTFHGIIFHWKINVFAETCQIAALLLLARSLSIF